MNLPLAGQTYTPTCSTSFGKTIEGNPKIIAHVEETFKKTLEDHRMISQDDNVLVAVSGGKDSTVLLYLLHKFGYKVEAVTVDAHIGCYSEENLKNIKSFCKSLDVPLYVASFNENYGSSVCHITDTLKEKGEQLGTCTVCGVLRRRLLNKAARELKATKVALGHNMDDEAQAVLMNLFYNRSTLNARVGPNPGLNRYEGFVPRIKPLFFITEEDITHYSQAKGFPVKYGDCPCSVKSTRYNLKQYIKEVEQDYPDMKKNVLTFILSKQEHLRKKYENATPPETCSDCGEPTATKTCRACDILNKFKAVQEA